MWGSVSCWCGQGIPPLQEAEVRKRHVVVLSEGERARLHTLIGQGVAPARVLTHARILLKANQGEARLVALACSAPPEGHKRWTLRLLAERLVELAVVETISYETVRQAVKQTGSSRG